MNMAPLRYYRELGKNLFVPERFRPSLDLFTGMIRMYIHRSFYMKIKYPLKWNILFVKQAVCQFSW